MTDYKIVKAIRNGNEYNIPGGSGLDGGVLEVFLVGGGGDGGTSGSLCGGGGGGGGLVIQSYSIVNECPYEVKVGMHGGGHTTFNGLYAIGGGNGGNSGAGLGGGNGGGAGGNGSSSKLCNAGGTGFHKGGYSCCYCHCPGGGGGGGMGGDGSDVTTSGGAGGLGIISDFSGTPQCYSGGGGGGGGTWSNPEVGGCGCYGGGNGGGKGRCYCGDNATTYGSGGGGGGNGNIGGSGCQGVAMLRYHTDGSDGILSGIGGTKYTCGDYTIHCFTSDGYFTPILSRGSKIIKYLGVGGGAGGAGCCCRFGGGGGQVIAGELLINDGDICITIGSGGNGSNYRWEGCCGCNTYIGTCVATGGNYKGQGYIGFDGNRHGATNSGGGGCSGLCGYGGGGGTGGRCASPGCEGYNGYPGIDGGGDGATYGCSRGCDATNYGGGGGGASYSTTYGGKGCQGVAEICYLINGGCGFTTATGGDYCYTCDGYCVHRFTSDGTFTVVS